MFSLDFNAMQAWLQSKDPNEIVGVAVDAQRCPVANFLRETTIPDINAIFMYIEYKDSINSLLIDRSRNEECSEATIFYINELDASTVSFNKNERSLNLTAAKCLNIMNKIRLSINE